MPVNEWHIVVYLDDLFGDPDNPATTPEARAEIAKRLRASGWPELTGSPKRLDHLIRGFAAPDEDDAELWWQGIFDLADVDRVWLDVYGIERMRRERIAAEKTTG